MKKAIITKVLRNDEIAPGIHKIEIEKNEELCTVNPGQFLHIKCGQEEGLLLRRPISISYTDEERITLVIKNVGKGTMLLCKSKIGQEWDILGPLGNGFTINESDKKVMVVGGGIGVAPLLELTKRLKDKETTILLGFQGNPFLIEEFEKHGNVMVATEDGSMGYKGFVNDLVLKSITREKSDILYTCGPKPMLLGIQKLCREYNIQSQVSLEEKMACGVGACLVCACKLKNNNDGHSYAKTCKDGPVFSMDEVIFDE